jgi:hypothetical protein
MGPQLGETFLHKHILEKKSSPKSTGQLQSNLMQIILAGRQFKFV